MKKTLGLFLVLVLVLGTMVGCTEGEVVEPQTDVDVVYGGPSSIDEPKVTPEPIVEEEPLIEEEPVIEEENIPAYLEVFGEITEIVEREQGLYLSVKGIEKESEEQAVFVVTEETYKLNDIDFAVGDKVKGFYPSDSIMIMIYPPQYSLTAISKVEEGVFTKADRFDENLLSKDKQLQLNIGEGVIVVNGDLENLTGKDLLVVYDMTTRSIPAQTTPSQIIVLK